MTLEGLEAAILNAASEAVGAACDEICETAKTLCPVESGQLRQSLLAAAENDGSGASGSVSAGAFYAGMVELGTWKQSPQPYLQPAFELHKSKVAEDVARRIRAAL